MERLPKRLLDKSVDSHCRTGFRWCTCNYCKTKWLGTARLQNAGWIGGWEFRERYRSTLREELRTELQELKQQII